MRAQRLSYEDKVKRDKKIGNCTTCPVCFKKTLSYWEAERYLICKSCGSNWQRKVKSSRKKKNE